MDIDPRNNTIVFEIKRWFKKEKVVEQSPTMSNDGIQSAWLRVQQKTKAKPGSVTRIYSEWGASQQDAAFIRRTFPGAAFTYSFNRPAPDDWDRALADAAATIRKQMGLPETPAPQLLPVLRTFMPNDVFAEAVVHRVIGADLAIYLAHCGMTPRGTIGIDYLIKAKATGALEAYFEEAYASMRHGLEVQVGQSKGSRLVALKHPSDMGASALCLPDFLQQMQPLVGTEEIFAAFFDPAHLFVTAPGTPAAAELQDATTQSDYWGAVALTPACYVIGPNQWRQVAARPAKS